MRINKIIPLTPLPADNHIDNHHELNAVDPTLRRNVEITKVQTM